jgi:hypothetical protein
MLPVHKNLNVRAGGGCYRVNDVLKYVLSLSAARVGLTEVTQHCQTSSVQPAVQVCDRATRPSHGVPTLEVQLLATSVPSSKGRTM